MLYLGRPRPSVVVEAYRHHVDPYAEEGMTGAMVQPRRVLSVQVDVTDVLDLRAPESLDHLGITEDDLLSPVGQYEPCWQIARAAHQLNLHGVLAPAATGLGETLALYEEHLPAAELPRLVSDAEVWEDGLPHDPRVLRPVRETDAG